MQCRNRRGAPEAATVLRYVWISTFAHLQKAVGTPSETDHQGPREKTDQTLRDFIYIRHTASVCTCLHALNNLAHHCSRRRVTAAEVATICSIILVDGGYPVRPGATSQILGLQVIMGRLIYHMSAPVPGATDGVPCHWPQGRLFVPLDVRVASVTHTTLLKFSC